MGREYPSIWWSLHSREQGGPHTRWHDTTLLHYCRSSNAGGDKLPHTTQHHSRPYGTSIYNAGGDKLPHTTQHHSRPYGTSLLEDANLQRRHRSPVRGRRPAPPHNPALPPPLRPIH